MRDCTSCREDARVRTREAYRVHSVFVRVPVRAPQTVIIVTVITRVEETTAVPCVWIRPGLEASWFAGS